MSRTSGTLASNFFNGQTIEVTGVAQFPSRRVAAGVFDYQRYLPRRGIQIGCRERLARSLRIFSTVKRLKLRVSLNSHHDESLKACSTTNAISGSVAFRSDVANVWHARFEFFQRSND